MLKNAVYTLPSLKEEESMGLMSARKCEGFETVPRLQAELATWFHGDWCNSQGSWVRGQWKAYYFSNSSSQIISIFSSGSLALVLRGQNQISVRAVGSKRETLNHGSLFFYNEQEACLPITLVRLSCRSVCCISILEKKIQNKEQSVLC